jgi:hypothetical protein
LNGQLERCAYGFDESVAGRLQRQTDIAYDLEHDIYGILAAISDVAKMGISMRHLLGIRWKYQITRKAAITLMRLYDSYGEIPGAIFQREGMNAYVVRNIRDRTIKYLINHHMIILDGGWYRLCYQEIFKSLRDLQGLNEFSGFDRIFQPVDGE